MSSRSGGHAAVGVVSLALGTVCLTLGIWRPSWLGGAFLSLSTPALLMVAGSVLALSGGLVLLFFIRQEPEPEPEVPAHVAFYTKMEKPRLVPEPAPRPGVKRRAPAMAATPTPGASPKAAVDSEMEQIDAQIRDLTRRINKAGVMLATGQLSQGGYVAYVEDLKKQRGKLEAIRVHAELS